MSTWIGNDFVAVEYLNAGGQQLTFHIPIAPRREVYQFPPFPAAEETRRIPIAPRREVYQSPVPAQEQNHGMQIAPDVPVDHTEIPGWYPYRKPAAPEEDNLLQDNRRMMMPVDRSENNGRHRRCPVPRQEETFQHNQSVMMAPADVSLAAVPEYYHEYNVPAREENFQHNHGMPQVQRVNAVHGVNQVPIRATEEDRGMPRAHYYVPPPPGFPELNHHFPLPTPPQKTGLTVYSSRNVCHLVCYGTPEATENSTFVLQNKLSLDFFPEKIKIFCWKKEDRKNEAMNTVETSHQLPAASNAGERAPRVFIRGVPKSLRLLEVQNLLKRLPDALLGLDDVSLPMENETFNRGFAFLQFRTLALAEEAINLLNKSKIQDCALQALWADPEPKSSAELIEQSDGIHVSNLNRATTREKLREFFGGERKVRRVVICHQRFAFVHFWDKENARRAVEEFHRADLDGCIIDVKIANPPPAGKSTNSGNNGHRSTETTSAPLPVYGEFPTMWLPAGYRIEPGLPMMPMAASSMFPMAHQSPYPVMPMPPVPLMTSGFPSTETAAFTPSSSLSQLMAPLSSTPSLASGSMRSTGVRIGDKRRHNDIGQDTQLPPQPPKTNVQKLNEWCSTSGLGLPYYAAVNVPGTQMVMGVAFIGGLNPIFGLPTTTAVEAYNSAAAIALTTLQPSILQ